MVIDNDRPSSFIMRVRSDLIETFKIMNVEYDFNQDLFFSSIKVVDEDMTRNCSIKDSESKLESMISATELVISHYLIICRLR